MELKTEGIVLKNYNKGENDNITVIFTREEGKVLVSSKSTRKIKSKLKFCIELFSLNKYFLVRKNKGSKYYTLAQAEPLRTFESVRNSLRKIGFSYLVVDLLNKFLQLEDPHVELFDITKEVLHVVDGGAYSNIENVEAFFKLKLLSLAGFNLSDDSAFLSSSDAVKKVKETVSEVKKSDNPSKLDIEYSLIREANMLIDSYIIHQLGEDVASLRMLGGIRKDD